MIFRLASVLVGGWLILEISQSIHATFTAVLTAISQIGG